MHLFRLSSKFVVRHDMPRIFCIYAHATSQVPVPFRSSSVRPMSESCDNLSTVTEVYRKWCNTAVCSECGHLTALPMRNEKESGGFTGRIFKKTENVKGSFG